MNRHPAVIRRRFARVARLVAGAGLLVLLLWTADVSAAWDMMTALTYTDVMLALMFLFVSSTLVGSTLLLILGREVNLPLTVAVLKAHFAGVVLSDATPARSGYLATPVLLEWYAGIPRAKGLAAVVQMQAVSLLARASLTCAAALYLRSRVPTGYALADITQSILSGGVALAIVGVLLGVAVWTTFYERILQLAGGLSLPVSPMLRCVGEWLHEFRGSSRTGVSRIVVVGGVTMVSAITAGLALVPIAQATGLAGLNELDVVAISLLAGPLVYLPLSIAGLGVMEGAYVLVLVAMGQIGASAVAFALAARLLVITADLVGLPWLIVGMNRAHISRSVGSIGDRPRPSTVS